MDDGLNPGFLPRWIVVLGFEADADQLEAQLTQLGESQRHIRQDGSKSILTLLIAHIDAESAQLAAVEFVHRALGLAPVVRSVVEAPRFVPN